MSRATIFVAAMAFVLACISVFYGKLASDAARSSQEEVRKLSGEILTTLAVLAQRRQGPAESDEPDPSRAERSSKKPGDKKDAAPSASQLKELEARVAKMEGAEAPSVFPLKKELFQRFKDLKGEGKLAALGQIANLARWGDEEAVDVMVGALGDEDEKVREDAVEHVGDLGNPELFGHIETAAKDPSSGVREEVASTLRNVGAEKAAPVLASLLSDADPEVVMEAIQTAASLNCREALPQITALAQGTDVDVATQAGITLRKLEQGAAADQVIARLAEGLQSKEGYERRKAVRRIAKVGGDAAQPYLKQALEDPDESVRALAKEALGESAEK